MVPLFEDEEEPVIPTAHDEALALALQQEELGSDEDEADADLARALAQSGRCAEQAQRVEIAGREVHLGEDSDESLEEVSLAPSGRSTPQPLSADHTTQEAIEFTDEDDLEEIPALPRVTKPTVPVTAQVTSTKALNVIDEALEEVKASPQRALDTTSQRIKLSSKSKAIDPPPVLAPSRQEPLKDFEPIVVGDKDSLFSRPAPPARTASGSKSRLRTTTIAEPGKQELTSQPRIPSNGIIQPSPLLEPDRSLQAVPIPPIEIVQAESSIRNMPSVQPPSATFPKSPLHEEQAELVGAIPLWSSEFRQPLPPPIHPVRLGKRKKAFNGVVKTASISRSVSTEPSDRQDTDHDEVQRHGDETDDEDDSRSIAWSKSPSPAALSRPPLHTEQSGETIPSEVEDEDVDMAHEDMVAEEDDYARFMAQIKNRDLNDVRTEIDDEIRVLNSQNKVAMRDSDEITQAMIAQIQVSHAIQLSLRVDSTSSLRHPLHHGTVGG